MLKELKGVLVPMVTPFKADESLDEAGLRRIVNYLIESGVHGLFPAGSQGEFYALTPDERKRIADVVIEETDGRVLVMVGTGAVTTRESIELTQYAEAAGADVASVITPYFISPSPDELRRHYVRIAKSVSFPVLAYNNPGRTGVHFTPADAAYVAGMADNFVGIKDSSGDLTNATAYIDQCPPSFKVFMGRDTLIYAALCCGCAGAVAATANVVPKLVVGIYDAFISGDHARALKLQRNLNPLRRAFGLGSFPVVAKDAMALVGQPTGPARTPISSITGEARQALVSVLRDLGRLK